MIGKEIEWIVTNVHKNSSVVAKLIFFTMAMISGPLMSYYASNTFIFPGEITLRNIE